MDLSELASPCQNRRERQLGQVLIVEDEEVLGRHYARIVARLGGEATVVAGVRAALDVVRAANPWGGLILDEGLPDGSGLEILSWLRVNDQRMPALVVTGLRSEDDLLIRAFELQARILYKLISTKHLEQFLSEIGEIPTGEPSPARRCRGDLPADLGALVFEVLRAADAEGRAHADYAYRLANLARAVSSRSGYGHRVAEKCAIAANVSRSELQRFIAITTRWTPSEIRTLLCHRDDHGRSLTVHHLLSILTAPANERSHIERSLREGQDVGKLRSFLKSLPSRDRRPVGQKSS